MQNEIVEAISLDEEVNRIATYVFEQDDVPKGAILQVFKPVQSTHAGWTMILIRHPATKSDEAA